MHSVESAALTQAPIMVEVTRGDLVESVHRASLVLTDPSGEIVASWGDVESPIYPRSALKPIQAISMVDLGLDLANEELAVACSSHAGTPLHTSTVLRILRHAGLTEADLDNTPDLPLDPDLRARERVARSTPRSLWQNCSGKHAGMLATCVVNKWPTRDYLDPEHPLQMAIRGTVQSWCGPIGAATTDGCGAPAFAVSLAGLARAFGSLATAAPQTPGARVLGAMREFPEFVGGPGRHVTELMQQVPGLVAKDGAESVYAAALADGSGLAFKIADGGGGVYDGSDRARRVLLAAGLKYLGVSSQWLESTSRVDVLGHGQPVGEVRAVGIA